MKDSVYALREPDSRQYIAFADENREPHLAPLHLATLAPATEAGLNELAQLASRRLPGQRYELERVDAL